MNNRSLDFPTSHGRHISKSDSRLHRSVSCGSDRTLMPYASSVTSHYHGVRARTGSSPTQYFQPTNGNPVRLHPGYTSGPQCPFQIDDQHNYAALDISQPGYPFPNAAFGNSSAGQGHEGLQLEFTHYENGSQYTYQHGDLNNDALFGMDQPQYHFPNTALDTGSMIPVYDDLESNLWEMSPLGTTPSNALGMHPGPFFNTPRMLHTNGAQLKPAIPSATAPVPGSVAASIVNNGSNRCHICNRTLGRPQDLRRHLTIHGPRDLKCSFNGCNMAFRRKDHLRRHLKVHECANPLRS